MGSCPDWYRLIAAAKYLGVAPWDLMHQPMAWTFYAEAAMTAENKAQAVFQAKAQRQAQRANRRA